MTRDLEPQESDGAAPPVVCSGCGGVASPALPAWQWSNETDPQTGRRSSLCPACTREHSRSIEARLDESWWD